MAPRQRQWEPVACPSEGFGAPIGHVCLELYKGNGACLRTLGGEVLKKKAFMEELGLEDVSLTKLAVVQRRADGGWQPVGTLGELSRLRQSAAGQAAAPQPAAALPQAPNLPHSPPRPATATRRRQPRRLAALAVAAAPVSPEVIVISSDEEDEPAAVPEAIPAAPPPPAAPPLVLPPAPQAALPAVPAAAPPIAQPPAQAVGLPAAVAPAAPAARLPAVAIAVPAALPVAAPLPAALPAAPPAPPAAVPPPPAAVPPPPAAQPAPAPPPHPAAYQAAVPPPAALPAAAPAPPPAALPPEVAGPAGGVAPPAPAARQPVAAAPAVVVPPAALPALVVAAPAGVPAAQALALAPALAAAPARAPAPVPALQPSPPRAPRLSAAPPLPRSSASRRRSLLACPTCKSLRRGATAEAAAAAVECPVCFCEVDAEHTHLDCGHAYCNTCLANYMHAVYQRGQHPACQLEACQQLLSAEDLQQAVLVLCESGDVEQQRTAARLPQLGDPFAVHQRFTDLAAAAVARAGGGELIECQHCHYRMLAEEGAPDDALCPNCRVGRPILDAKAAAQRPKGIQQLEGGERVLYCPGCGFGPQQKSQYCNKLCCGGCKAMLCWCCGEVIGDQRAYDHFVGGGGGAGRCPLYGLPGQRPQMTVQEEEQAQERAVQREQRDQALWDRLIHPAHDAVRHMRHATPPDLQRDEAVWLQMRRVTHTTLERCFNELTETAARLEVEMTVHELRDMLVRRAAPQLAASWPGWDVWEGVVGGVLCAMTRALS